MWPINTTKGRKLKSSLECFHHIRKKKKKIQPKGPAAHCSHAHVRFAIEEPREQYGDVQYSHGSSVQHGQSLRMR